MGVEVLTSSEEETKFIGVKFCDIENVRLPEKIAEGSDNRHFNRGGLLY